MSTEFSDSSSAPHPELPVKTDASLEVLPASPPLLIDAANQPNKHQPDKHQPDKVETAQVPAFSLNSATPIAAPAIGESQDLLIASVAESLHASKPAKSNAAKEAEFNLRFWVAVVGLGFVLLVAVSDWRSKDGPPIPFPSTSKIPQVR